MGPGRRIENPARPPPAGHDHFLFLNALFFFLVANKTNLPLWRHRWLHDLADRVKDDPEFLIVFPLHIIEPAGEVFVGNHRLAHLHKGLDDADIDLSGTLATQHAGQHGNALFSENIGKIAAATMT